MSVKQTIPVPSENQLSARADVCLSNGITKSLIGLSGGIVASLLIFRRRAFPIWIGLGFGAGQGWAECDRLYNPYSIPGYRQLGKGEDENGLPQLKYGDSQFVKDAKHKIQEGVEKVKEAAKPAADKAQDKAEHALEQGKQEGKSLWESAKSAFGQAKDAAASATSGKGGNGFEEVKDELKRFAEGPNAHGDKIDVPGAQEVKDELKRFAEGPNAHSEEKIDLKDLKDGKRWV